MKRSVLPLLAFVASLGGFLFGYDTAVISGTISLVKAKFTLDAVAEGWFVSSALVGCIIGVSIAGYLSDRFGRKPVIALSALLFTLSALGCMLIGTHQALILYRLAGGIGVGVASLICPVYIAEISPARIRGRLVAFYQFSIALGILAAYFVNAGLLSLSGSHPYPAGSFLAWTINEEVWRSMFGSGMVPALLFIILVMVVPESPRWLAIKGKVDRARGILSRLDPTQTEVDHENTLKNISSEDSPSSLSLRSIFKAGLGPVLLLGIALAMLQQLSGINAILYYGPRIFESAGFSLSSALGGQVVIGIVMVVFTLLAIWKVDSWGRRTMLMIGAAGALIAHTIIGFLFNSGTTQGIFMLIMVLIFIACFAFSYGPVVWICLSEIFPNRIRGRAMSIATLMLWVTNALLGQLVPLMLEKFNTAYTFWIFALFCIPTLLLVWKVLPETRGKTLEEIELFWEKK
jgi:SP family arabinose:H+ symporter-like MFS transporter